ncbi:unnamed protein product [Urochloa decumbens]|uniref:Uncharacterized protein n=1 Tax=Urochloa decumbens TaxID=240449 RepID=A0ABC8VXT3_9POAL
MYWSEYVSQYWRARRLEQEKNRLFNEKRELEMQLVEKTKAAQVSSSQVFTLGLKVRELEHKNTELSGYLVKQKEDTRRAGLLFMEAADKYQQVAKKQIRAKVAELENARKASMMIMNAADTYQDVAKKQTKVKVEELEDMKVAVLVLMRAADTYQQEAKKQIKEKVEELKILGAEKAEMDARAASLESELNAALDKNQELEIGHDKLKIENNNLLLEVERLMTELGVLAEVKEAAAKAFDAEKAKIKKDSEDLRTKVEEFQASKDSTKGENGNFRSEILAVEKKHI